MRSEEIRRMNEALIGMIEEWNQANRPVSATSVRNRYDERPIWLTPMPCQDLVNRYFDLLWLHEIGVKL